MSFLHRSLLKSQNMRLTNRAKPGQAKDYTPLTWDKYFSELKDIKINDNIFRVYLSGTEGPTLALLHGGGYSALTWALFAQEIIQKIQCKVLAIDVRGHGETHTSDDDNLSIETLTEDVINVINNIYDDDEPIVFIGHSMGGALAVHCAQNLRNCVGLVVIDVVEGTALESLASMQTFLRNRPTTFLNIEHAIQWCVRSGQTHNIESARVSMPGQIKNTITGKLGASELTNQPTVDQIAIDKQMLAQTPTGIHVISEEQTEDNHHLTGGHVESNNAASVARQHSNMASAVMQPPNSYSWRINLSKTEVFWRGWFQGLSDLFLNVPIPKLLLLANIHGLDTALTVGQMQGKFQMQVLPKCGHAIHEDLPDKVSDIIAMYLIRQRLAISLSDFTPVLPGC